MKEKLNLRHLTIGGVDFYMCKINRGGLINYYTANSTLKLAKLKEYSKLEDNKLAELLWSKGRAVLSFS